ncbi:MAG: hypothetical protein HETSPECPRED_005677 [Heterodermia speciosa]|uniref:CFEM domain-containing protein n=1 Tax=Heterodermia speciosa TaxID=116794 RepID=A0A8H3FGE2_9LECA|nr:MAG: hypothetical protein HETSPECPRED_005677 [Heterodermia speciosa]
MELFTILMLLSVWFPLANAQVSTTAPSDALGDPAQLSSYPTCAQVCGNEANQFPRCDRSNVTCVCGPEYRSETAACESLTCSPTDYEKTQILAAQLCNPTYNNATASSVSAAIASATANATAYAGGKDPTDISFYPSCAQKCIEQYLPGSTCGSLSNRACICQGGVGRGELQQCEAPTCSPTDLQNLQYLVYELCTPVGGLGNSTNTTLSTQVPPVPTQTSFTGDGVSAFAKGVGGIALAVVGGLVIGL